MRHACLSPTRRRDIDSERCQQRTACWSSWPFDIQPSLNFNNLRSELKWGPENLERETEDPWWTWSLLSDWHTWGDDANSQSWIPEDSTMNEKFPWQLVPALGCDIQSSFPTAVLCRRWFWSDLPLEQRESRHHLWWLSLDIKQSKQFVYEFLRELHSDLTWLFLLDESAQELDGMLWPEVLDMLETEELLNLFLRNSEWTPRLRWPDHPRMPWLRCWPCLRNLYLRKDKCQISLDKDSFFEALKPSESSMSWRLSLQAAGSGHWISLGAWTNMSPLNSSTGMLRNTEATSELRDPTYEADSSWEWVWELLTWHVWGILGLPRVPKVLLMMLPLKSLPQLNRSCCIRKNTWTKWTTWETASWVSWLDLGVASETRTF